MLLKKVFKRIAFTILGIIGFLAFYLLLAFTLPKITISEENESANDITIYILTNGVHTDIVVPVKNELKDWSKIVRYDKTVSKDTSFQYLGMGWGDKGFYLETPTWEDLKASVAFKAATGLSSTAIHATFFKQLKEDASCKKILISKNQYQRLVDYIDASFQKDSVGNSLPIVTNANYGNTDAFYEANGSYSMLKTCNTWANNALKASGQRCCLWTPFDTGIFEKYE